MLDLFGTLVASPTPVERTQAASRLACVIGCETAKVDRYLRNTWQVRHDGTLPTVTDLAAHLARSVGRPDVTVESVADELIALGKARLAPDTTVAQTLESMRGRGLLLGILSDASAEIACAWPTTPLAALVDSAVFSCVAGCTKPGQQLYARISDALGVSVHRMLYVGDGGGDELRGALASGMIAIAVRRRGPGDGLAFGHTAWSGPVLNAVEQVPAYLAGLR